MRPCSMDRRPKVDVPSPIAINAGPNLKLVDVESSFVSTLADRNRVGPFDVPALLPLAEDAGKKSRPRTSR